MWTFVKQERFVFTFVFDAYSIPALQLINPGPHGIRMHRISLPTLFISLLFALPMSSVWASDSAANLDDIHAVNKNRTHNAQQSQARVDSLNDQKNKLFDEYRQVSKLIEGLKVYNRQLEVQTLAQQLQLQQLTESITQATQMKRQITPLMMEMTAGLSQFIALDLPFHAQERSQRLGFIHAALDNPDIADSEKFRQILEAYQIENEYGRKIDVYTETITVDAQPINVDVLQVGRIALLAQTKDQGDAWVWDNQQQQWQILASSHQKPIRDAIRIARKQAVSNLLMIPVSAPQQVIAGDAGDE